VDVPPEQGDIVKVKNEFGIVTDVYGTKVITRKLTKEEATRILQDRKNASISIGVADTNAPTFKRGGVTPKVAKPIVGDVIKVKGRYGVVTDVINNKVEVKNISQTDAFRILKNKN
jgi:NMD protein affecting ribosome stability and mRNA decay